MDLSLHDVKRIETQIRVFDKFNILELKVTDAQDRTFTIKLFADDMESLTQHNLPVHIAYDR